MHDVKIFYFSLYRLSIYGDKSLQVIIELRIFDQKKSHLMFLAQYFILHDSLINLLTFALFTLYKNQIIFRPFFF